jgi:VWFA-related protein
VRALGFLVAVTALLALVASAADVPARRTDPPVFSATTDLVNVTVTVTDREGRLVTDLGPDDFVLEEDGHQQAIQVFGRPGDPDDPDTRTGEALSIRFGILFDTSESMLDDIRLSQSAAVRFLDSIPRARELLTVFFDEDIRISRYASESQQGLFERILETRGSGNTALYDAVAAYLSRLEPGPGRQVLVLFTDGEDSGISDTSRAESLSLLRSQQVTVYAIAFDADRAGSARTMRGHSYLKDATDLSGGRMFRPMGYRDLPGIYDKIIEELGAQYALGYVSDRPAGADRLRKLKVSVRRPGLKVRHRTGYRAR